MVMFQPSLKDRLNVNKCLDELHWQTVEDPKQVIQAGVQQTS